MCAYFNKQVPTGTHAKACHAVLLIEGFNSGRSVREQGEREGVTVGKPKAVCAPVTKEVGTKYRSTRSVASPATMETARIKGHHKDTNLPNTGIITHCFKSRNKNKGELVFKALESKTLCARVTDLLIYTMHGIDSQHGHARLSPLAASWLLPRRPAFAHRLETSKARM